MGALLLSIGREAGWRFGLFLDEAHVDERLGVGRGRVDDALHRALGR